MSASIHHATRARAAAAGCEIVEADGSFLLLRTADRHTAGPFETAKIAAAAAQSVAVSSLYSCPGVRP